MESLLNLISDFVKDGIIADSSMLLIIISLLVFLYRAFLVPMLDKINIIPGIDDVKSVLETNADITKLNLEEVSKKLDKIVDVLDGIEDNDSNNRRDIIDLKRDVEQIKQILNQFQGHFMYNGNPGHFGNRELR